MKIALLDCETTGLEDDDEPVSIGVVTAELNDIREAVPIDSWYGEREPSVPISYMAKITHGLDAASLLGKRLDLDSLKSLLSSADIIVAHNARFDARMLYKLFPESLDMSWRCTLHQLRSFPEFDKSSLDSICNKFSIDRPSPHNALSDCKALLQALNRRTGSTIRSRTYIERIIEAPAWPVFRNKEPFLALESSDNIVFTSISEKILLECPVGTDIRVWTSEEIDFVIGYARLTGFGGPQAEMFRFKKIDNPKVTSKLGKETYYEVIGYQGVDILIAPAHV